MRRKVFAFSVQAHLHWMQVKDRLRSGRSQKREDYEDMLEAQSDKESDNG
jgi:hypothetical protein